MTKIQDIRAEVWKVAPSKTKRTFDRITTIVRHHSGGSSGDFNTFWSYWKSKGWTKGGYHELILRDGTVQLCYDPEYPTNGVANQNDYIYNICLVGDGTKQGFTEAQEKSWTERCLYNQDRLKVANRNVKGHNEMPGASTACPGINMHLVRNRLLNAVQKPKEETTLTQSYEKDAKVGGALKEDFEKAVANGITDGTFPHRPATRAEVAVMIQRATEKLK